MPLQSAGNDRVSRDLSHLWPHRAWAKGVTAIVCFLGFCGVAVASPITTFLGVDSNLASITAPEPNSDLARANLAAAAGALGQSLITNGLETLPVADLANGVRLDLGGGVGVTLANTASFTDGSGNVWGNGIRSDLNATTAANPGFGFNTTPGGEQFFRIVTPSVTPGNSVHSTATFDFSSPVNAFGLSLTGLGTDDGSSVTLQFLDGSTQTLSIAGGTLAQIEAEFFGFTDLNAAISSVTLDLALTNITTRQGYLYLLGLDDVSFSTPAVTAVPEPASLLLLGTGLLGLRRRWQQSLANR